MSEENKAVVRRFYEAFGAEDYEALNEVLAADLAAYAHSATTPATRDDAVQGIRMWNEAFADSQYTIELQLAEGARVATRVTLRAVHSRGEFMGVPPSGKEIVLKGTSIERIKDGRIAERWVNYDNAGLMQQLGLIPPVGERAG